MKKLTVVTVSFFNYTSEGLHTDLGTHLLDVLVASILSWLVITFFSSGLIKLELKIFI